MVSKDHTIAHEMHRHGYSQITKIGRGKYGYVVKAEKEGRIYAVKVTDLGEQGNVREVDTLCRIKHPNIIGLHEFFINEEHREINLVMDYAEMTLDTYITRHDVRKDIKVKMMYQITSALHCLHIHGIYHCDLKPANILIKNGDAYLADFGICNYKGNDMDICQSPPYQSPEYLDSDTALYIKKRRQTDRLNFHNCEIWALAVLFHYIYTDGIYLFTDEFGGYAKENFRKYHKDPTDYLDSRVPGKIKGLLVRMLTERIPIPEILKDPLFATIGCSSPIPGYSVSRRETSVIDRGEIPVVIEWMEECADDSEWTDRTARSMIELFNRSAHLVDNDRFRQDIQLVGAACMVIATELYEWEPINTEDVCVLCDKAYNRTQVDTMKAKIMMELGGIITIE